MNVREGMTEVTAPVVKARTSDFLVIGGGIVGLSLALELRRHYRLSTITVIEKETSLGEHASGRNSGVLHAGFYYAADSLKARLTRDGNSAMTQYCLERRLRINRCGKLIVARNEGEHAVLDELLRRASRNGVELREIAEKEAREIEPSVRTCRKALFSPTTSSVDPLQVLQSLREDAVHAGIAILTGTKYLGVRRFENSTAVQTSRGEQVAGYVINAAGMYADKIARDFGFGRLYRILPFRGLYLYCQAPAFRLRTHVYPAPDLKLPFLGVHFTVGVHGQIKVGPTAIPAFWREHYGGLHRFDAGELAEIVGVQTKLFLDKSSGFRTVGAEELRKSMKRLVIRRAEELAGPLPGTGFWRWGKPGLRAQLVNTQSRRLEMDFLHEGDPRSFHVLNAVSPGFTCAFSFAGYLFSQIERCLNGRPAGSPSPSDAVCHV
jgi:L-2-hydroxyglutarate oxidase LhgO